MQTQHLSPFAETCLARQGFDTVACDDRRFALALRFTPAVCLSLVVVALALQSAILFAVLGATAFAAALGHRHLLDIVYDMAVRPLVHGPALPANPAPRRFAFVLSTPMLACAALAFATGAKGIGVAIGAVQLGACALYVSTGWCPASFIHNTLFRSGPNGVA